MPPTITHEKGPAVPREYYSRNGSPASRYLSFGSIVPSHPIHRSYKPFVNKELLSVCYVHNLETFLLPYSQ
jgi:hypothetical protein